jgi:hypothetical protein
MARRAPPRARQSATDLDAQLRDLFAQPLADAALRSRLDDLTDEAAFPPLVPLWGPILYRRNRVVFVPLILEHFPQVWARAPWGTAPTVLGEWLQEVERNGDLELFRRLYSWKITKERGFPDEERWWSDLKQAYTDATSWQERLQALVKYEIGLQLREEQAVELYERDPGPARDFILRHTLSSGGRGAAGRLPQRLLDSARRRNDEEFVFALYRRSVSNEEWQADVVGLCLTLADQDRLLKALDERHPEGRRDVAPCFHELLLERGRDVIPYVLKHLRSLADGSGEAGAGWLLALARKFR